METIDKLYLELSNITAARNSREHNLAIMVMRLSRTVKKYDPKSTIAEAAVSLVERLGLPTTGSSLRDDQ